MKINHLQKILLKYKLIFSCAIVNFIFWGAYIFATDDWRIEILNTSDMGLSPIKTLIYKQPDIYNKFFYTWLQTIPNMVKFITALIFSGIVISAISPKKTSFTFRLLIVITLLSLVLVGLLETHKFSTRYTFFLYPVLLLVSAGTVWEILKRCTASKIISSFALIGAMSIYAIYSEDHGIHHLMNITSKEINFRMYYPDSLRRHYYSRNDTRSPAQYVNRHAKKSDTIISFSMVPAFYLHKQDYRYVDRNSRFFSNFSTCYGKRERWSNSQLLYKFEDLIKLVNKQTSPVWIILPKYYTELSNKINKHFTSKLVYTNLNDRINVLRIAPGRSNTAPVSPTTSQGKLP